ncbi:hypothetical protein GCM10009113_05290 [Marinobacter szutsaonensis]
MLQGAITGEQQEALGIKIETTGRIDVLKWNPVSQSLAGRLVRVVASVGELAENLERFIEQNEFGHA